MKYRIIVETEASGKKWYYVQYRYLFFFWLYHREVRDISMYAYKIGWNTLEEAEKHIRSNKKYMDAENLKRIVKREVL